MGHLPHPCCHHSASPRLDPEQHDRIASTCIDAYRALPANGAKPARRSNSRLEWSILAGLVLSLPGNRHPNDHRYLAISIATGLKCLPYHRLPLSGDVLHDTHAEVLARRGARRWLLARLHHELAAAASSRAHAPSTQSDPLPFIFALDPATARWKLRSDVSLHWYVSALPCGDASTLLLAFQQSKQDQHLATTDAITPTQLLDASIRDDANADAPAPPSSSARRAPSRGRAGQSRSNTLRTKPGRPDSPPSTCMSCSDKLALWNQVGIQGSLASCLLDPIVPRSIVVGDQAIRAIFEPDTLEFARLTALLATRCQAALYGRIASDTAAKPTVAWTSVSFDDSRESIERLARAEMQSAEPTASWTEYQPTSCAASVLFSPPPCPVSPALHENLVAGTKMGAPSRRKTSSDVLRPSSRSKVCKLDFYRDAMLVLRQLRPERYRLASTYYQVKHCLDDDGIRSYRERKAKLVGQRSNVKHDAQLDALVERFLQSRETAISHTVTGAETEVKEDAVPPGDASESGSVPFQAWLVTPSRFERFDETGCIVDATPSPLLPS